MIDRLALSVPEEMRRPLAAVAVAVGLVVALLAGLAGTVLVADERTEALAASEQELAMLIARVRDRTPATARAERILAGDPFLAETTATLAVNALQRRVTTIAEDCGVALRSIGRDEAREAGFDRLAASALRVEAEASTAAMQRLLYRLETETPFVVIDELRVRPSGRERAGEAAGDRLSIDLVVVGFRRRGEG